jgi:hypothetical protein
MVDLNYVKAGVDLAVPKLADCLYFDCLTKKAQARAAQTLLKAVHAESKTGPLLAKQRMKLQSRTFSVVVLRVYFQTP